MTRDLVDLTAVAGLAEEVSRGPEGVGEGSTRGGGGEVVEQRGEEADAAGEVGAGAAQGPTRLRERRDLVGHPLRHRNADFPFFRSRLSSHSRSTSTSSPLLVNAGGQQAKPTQDDDRVVRSTKPSLSCSVALSHSHFILHPRMGAYLSTFSIHTSKFIATFPNKYSNKIYYYLFTRI